MCLCVFFFEAEEGIRDLVRSRGLGDVYKRQIESKAQDIKGKTNACDIGFKNSKGEIIIFLDADTIVEPKFIHKIRELFSDIDQEVVTIQPKHRSKKFFEQLSLFFHISSIVSTGVVSTIPFGFGLYGPCIAMRRQIYETTNGFINTKVKNSIIEDVALSIVMKTQKVSITRYLGDGLISYRMFENFSILFLERACCHMYLESAPCRVCVCSVVTCSFDPCSALS